MDICSLAFGVWVTLQACYSPVVCSKNAEGTREFCSGGYPMGCTQPAPVWQCKRPDGTLYTLTQGEADRDRGHKGPTLGIQ